jgi:hypothetical protein
VLDDVLAAVGNVEDVAVCPLRSQGFGGDTGIFQVNRRDVLCHTVR